MPCGRGVEAVSDLALFHSQSFAAPEDVRLAAEVLRALTSGSSAAAAPRRCFGAVRFLAARISLTDDVYTIYPTHNFSGPNSHFLRTFDRLAELVRPTSLRHTLTCDCHAAYYIK